MGKPHYYQKVINSQPPLIFVYGVAILALPGAFSLASAVRFWNGRKALPLTTAAQNMHDLRRCPCEVSATFSVPIILRNSYKAPPKFLGHLRLREPRRQPF